MSRNMVPVMLGLTVFTAAAMAIAAYLVASAGLGMAAVAGAILLLALGVLATAAAALARFSSHERQLNAQKDHLQRLSGRAETAFARIAALEERETETDPRLGIVMAEVEVLRRDVHQLRRARNQPSPEQGQAPHVADTGFKPAAGGQPETDKLNLELEPVIDLAAGSTSHYRAHLSLAGDGGGGIAHEQLIEKAALGGLRPALDVRLVRLVAPVLRRLRAKNPGLRIFVPLGRATLGAREEAGRLLALLQRDADVASGMVFEFTQSDLGRLEGPGIETLARLARSGALLALRDGAAESLDLGTLRQLGIRYLTLPPGAADAGEGPTSAAWNDFLNHARALQIQLIAGSIRTPQQATAANKFARFAFGPFFAPPRKVRADAGVPATVAHNANVA